VLKQNYSRSKRNLNLSDVAIKKAPVVHCEAVTEAVQPGMGMTSRVIPAQGEERGASFTLIRSDRDAA
jgi:hypothetical protein